jgi:hypothetical protein
MGQLLLQGYDQEILNGEHLRAAYLYDERKYAHDPRMRLIDVSGQDSKYVWDESNIYYRVDDDQRTIMSGQVLIRGMLGPEIAQFFQTNKHNPVIPLHTMDRENDIVAPNEQTCPRLTEIRERYERSDQFRSFNQSAESVQLRGFMANVLKIDGDMESIDCLMTTICTDRLLPDAINDYTGDGSDRRRLHSKNNFQRLFDFGVTKETLSFLANDAEYSKLAMGPLWAEIMANINEVVNKEHYYRNPVKLALFSGHDTTLIPLLASLGPKVWDGQWPSYASMVLIEIHEINIDRHLEIHEINIDGRSDKSMYKINYAFRLLLDGKVLTHTLDGCPDDAELCDADVFIRRVTPFAKNERECARVHGRPEEYTDTSTMGGVIAFALLVVGSALVVYLMGAMPTRRHGRTSAAKSYEDVGIALTSYENGNASRHYSDEAEVSYGFQS